MNVPRPPSRPGPVSEPRGGWLRPRDGVVEFAAVPPSAAGIDVIVAAARFASDRRIGPDLRAWIERLSPAELVWTPSTTSLLLDLLRRGNASSWTFLSDVDFVAKAFPGLEPTNGEAPSFRAVESLRDITAVANAESDTLLIGAFVGGIFSDLRNVAAALDIMGLAPDAAEEIVDLVSGARVLLASIERENLVVDTRFLNHIAHGLRRPGIVERSRLLAGAIGDPQPWQHAAMIEITTGVQVALAHPELLDQPSDSLEALLRREATALTGDHLVRMRIAQAPTAYVLAHEPADLLRHVSLIEPTPAASRVRVVVDSQLPGMYVVNVVCVDRTGLLSRLTAVLAAEGLSVVSAGLATWPDGTVLDSFVVESTLRPDAGRLSEQFEHALRTDPPAPVLAEPAPALALDNSLHPLHSVLRVAGHDQLGLLSAVSRAIAAVGLVIHHATIRTTNGTVDDDFEVSLPDGSRIDADAVESIRRHLAASCRTAA